MDNISVFKQIASKGKNVFLYPSPTYEYNNIILGCPVVENGYCTKMFAVASNTWRGFHKIDKWEKGAGSVFNEYFIENKTQIILKLISIENIEQLDKFEDEICTEIKSCLSNIQPKMLNSYNKIRKPVDLFIENIVSMSDNIEQNRHKFVPLLFLPLDNWIFKTPHIFNSSELISCGLNKKSTSKDVYHKTVYLKLQNIVYNKAANLQNHIKSSFFRIFFDFFWNERYTRDGSNLFMTNI